VLFRNRKARFRYPVGPAPRTAILGPWFRARNGRVRVFSGGWCEAAAAFAPAAIAGTREPLLELAAGAAPALTHALIVISRPGDPLLPPADRERLWRAFRVPVFQQIVGARGELLAAECEAHDGLHVETPDRDWSGYSVETGVCACGRKTPRLAFPRVAQASGA
jgi:hypothetical protein